MFFCSGRAGSKITEIRRLSGSKISIAKTPHDDSGERMFTIVGPPEANEKALFLLYNQLESESRFGRDLCHRNLAHWFCTFRREAKACRGHLGRTYRRGDLSASTMPIGVFVLEFPTSSKQRNLPNPFYSSPSSPHRLVKTLPPSLSKNLRRTCESHIMICLDPRIATEVTECKVSKQLGRMCVYRTLSP